MSHLQLDIKIQDQSVKQVMNPKLSELQLPRIYRGNLTLRIFAIR